MMKQMKLLLKNRDMGTGVVRPSSGVAANRLHNIWRMRNA